MSFTINEPMPEKLLIHIREVVKTTAEHWKISNRIKEEKAAKSASTIRDLINGAPVTEGNARAAIEIVNYAVSKCHSIVNKHSGLISEISQYQIKDHANRH